MSAIKRATSWLSTVAFLLSLAIASPGWAQGKAAEDDDVPPPVKKKTVKKKVPAAAPEDEEPPAKPAPKPAAKAAPPKAAPGKGEEEDEPPAPVELKGSDLMTRDGVMLRATFFPGTKGKESVPVMLLHGYRGDRTQYSNLAPDLQRRGCAVLAADLRGHGESTQVKAGGYIETLDASKMAVDQFRRMVEYDMETLKGFLKQQNNQGELNLEKLCIVGADMGAMVAMEWARFDWSWPQYPGKKQGQYVKALVLISPMWLFKGLDARSALNHPLVSRAISIQIFVGSGDPKSLEEAKRIHSALERIHGKPPADEDQRVERQDLFFKQFDTKLQGGKMLAVRGLNLEPRIAQFIELRLAHKDFPWHEIGKKN